MSGKYDPDYWFLGEDETVTITLRETSQATTIPQNELLGRRSSGWKYQYDSLNAQLRVDGEKELSGEKELTRTYTSNNEVTPLIDGEAFMSDLYKEMGKLKKDDFALIAGWEFWQHRSLVQRVYEDIAEDDTFLPAVLGKVAESEATVRVLAFGKGPPGCDERTKNFVEEVNKICKNSACLAAPINFAMSHHQKEVLLATSRFEDSRAYVGGMDLAVNRWDDSSHKAKHREAGPRQIIKSRTLRKGNYGWHDIQVVVRGDAILQLWANFAERWDNERRDKDLLRCPVPNWVKGQSWPFRKTKMGKQHVQVLRTVGPAAGAEGRARFMPYGERTVLCALKKAIERAECYIYIEEQFLWDCELADFIAEKMNEQGSKVRLIIVMTAGCELPAKFGQYGFFLRDAFFRKILSVDRTGNVVFGDTTRIYPYGLFQTKDDGHEEIYVHSKLFIIDDRYVAIGSANVDARSMHIETELTLGIVDGETVKSKLDGGDATVCKFARDLRNQLWSEHSGNSAPKPIDDPIEALKKCFPGVVTPWPNNEKEAKRRQAHHLRCYINNPGANLSRPWMRRLIDRNERKWYQFEE